MKITQRMKIISDQIKQLEKEHPEYSWKNMGALLGSAGEVFACEELGLKPAPASAKGYDATDKNGLTYQIKTTSVKTATFRFHNLTGDSFDRLVVIRYCQGKFNVEYNSPLIFKDLRKNSYVNSFDLRWKQH